MVGDEFASPTTGPPTSASDIRALVTAYGGMAGPMTAIGTKLRKFAVQRFRQQVRGTADQD